MNGSFFPLVPLIWFDPDSRCSRAISYTRRRKCIRMIVTITRATADAEVGMNVWFPKSNIVYNCTDSVRAHTGTVSQDTSTLYFGCAYLSPIYCTMQCSQSQHCEQSPYTKPHTCRERVSLFVSLFFSGISEPEEVSHGRPSVRTVPRRIQVL